MSGVRVIPARSVAPTPWKNGRGSARELLQWPPSDAWQVRVSVADIDADGPFSSYPDVTRWFAVLEGAGVVLGFDDGDERVVRGDAPVKFDGAAAPTCTLIAGPARSLNLMLRDADGAMVNALDHRPWSPGTGPCGFYAAAGGVCHGGDRAVKVDADTLVWFESPPAVLRFAADASAAGFAGWWLQFSPHHASAA